MVTAYDVSAQKLIEVLAEDLSGKMKQPEWTKFVKTGPQATRVPSQKNWYFLKAASILRRIYVDGPVGTERFRTIYGGRRDRGTKPKRFVRSGGKIVRTILQDLDTQGLILKTPKGRTVAPKGVKLVDSLAKKISSE